MNPSIPVGNLLRANWGLYSLIEGKRSVPKNNPAGHIQAVLSNSSLRPPTMFRVPSQQNETFARVRSESFEELVMDTGKGKGTMDTGWASVKKLVNYARSIATLC
jgi:hypothetical protein